MYNIQQSKIHSQWRIQQDFNTDIPVVTPKLWCPKNKTKNFSTPTKKHIEFDLSILILLLFYLIKLFSTHFNFSLWVFGPSKFQLDKSLEFLEDIEWLICLIYSSSKNHLNWLSMRLIRSIHHSAKVT